MSIIPQLSKVWGWFTKAELCHDQKVLEGTALTNLSPALRGSQTNRPASHQMLWSPSVPDVAYGAYHLFAWLSHSGPNNTNTRASCFCPFLKVSVSAKCLICLFLFIVKSLWIDLIFFSLFQAGFLLHITVKMLLSRLLVTSNCCV